MRQRKASHLYGNDIRIKARDELGEFGPIVLDSK